MASITYSRGQFVSVTAYIADSTAAHTTTLGPFSVSFAPFTQPLMSGLWLLGLDIFFRVPTAVVSEKVFLQDISGNTVFTYQVDMPIAPSNPSWVIRDFGLQGIVTGTAVANQQSWKIFTPATVNGPGYSVNLYGYII